MKTNKLIDLLKLRKITQQELGDKIGMSKTALNQALQRQDFKTSTLEKIASVLGVPVSYFFDEGNGNNIIVKNGNDNLQVGYNNYQHNNHDLKEIEFLKDKIKQLEKIIELLEEKTGK